MTVADKLEPAVESKIAELKKRLGKEMKPSMLEDKQLFVRFLKARNYDLDLSEDMLRKHLQWRRENKVETILTEKPGTDKSSLELQEVLSYIGSSMIGFDKEHCPVNYFAVGETDWKAIRKSAKFADRYRYTIKLMEEESAVMEKQNKKLGKNIKGMVYICDLKNISFSIVTDKKLLSEMMDIFRMYQDNYPERLKQLVIINVSNYFLMAYHILKTVMAESIINKIRMYGSAEEYEPALLNLIDATELPQFLGGKKCDSKGDPLCNEFVKHGGALPAKYYVQKNKTSLSKCKNAKKLVVPRAAFSEIELKVEEAGSVIEWEFETKTRDIGFGLFYKELAQEEKITELVPLLRLDTEEFSETGMFKCEKPGTYILLFDNSYSWMRSKEIHYKASVISLKEHEKEMKSCA